VPPGGRIVGFYGVDLGEGCVGFGEIGVETDGFEEQRESFFLKALGAVELCEVVVRARVGGFGGDPAQLVGNFALSTRVKDRFDDFVAPETH